MIIKCKMCLTGYDFDGELITGNGIWVRCTKCRFVFFITAPVPLVSAHAEQDASKQETLTAPPMVQTNNITSHTDVTEEINSEILLTGKRRILPWVLAIIIACAITLFCVSFFFPSMQQQMKNIISVNYRAYFLTTKNTVLSQEETKSIEVRRVRQRVVMNAKLGQIVVEEGEVINKTSKTITDVKVEGKLCSDTGVTMQIMLAMCGNILTDAEVANLTKDEIISKLASVENHIRISPYAKAPFMLFFFHNGSVSTSNNSREIVTTKVDVKSASLY